MTATRLVPVLLLMGSAQFLLGQDRASARRVNYFIDASCEQCSAKGHASAKLWIATTETYEGFLADEAVLRNKFKEEIAKVWEADSVLTSSIVFRYQGTLGEILSTYAFKQDKMKKKGYTILKVTFRP